MFLRPCDDEAGKFPSDLVIILIRKAQTGGEFDNLTGEGRPIAGLEETHDPMWWVKKKIREENLSFVPVVLDLRRDIEREFERMRRVNFESKVRRLVTSLNARIRWANATNVAGPSTTLTPLDPDAVVRFWHEGRSARVPC